MSSPPGPAFGSVSFHSSEAGSSFIDIPEDFSQETLRNADFGLLPEESNNVRVARLRARCQGKAVEEYPEGLDPDDKEPGLDGSALAAKILEGLHQKNNKIDGWCRVTLLKPTKENGYAQVSWGGANKFCVVEELLLWAGGVIKNDQGDQCSHLCCKTLCLEVGHVCVESALLNNLRKGCAVWIDCPHKGCSKKILVCFHEPKCIKFCPGFLSWEDFMENGIH